MLATCAIFFLIQSLNQLVAAKRIKLKHAVSRLKNGLTLGMFVI